MEFPCKPTVDPLMDTWFESGLFAIAPASFKVLRNRTYDRQDLPLEGMVNGRTNTPVVHHLHTAVLISEAERWVKSSSHPVH